MDKRAVFDVIVRQLRDVVPEIGDRAIGYDNSFRALGANSVDRAEIIMLTLEELSAEVPLMAFAKAENIGEMADIIQQRLSSA